MDLKHAVTITTPAEDASIDADTVRVSGVVRDDRLSVEVNGKRMRADADGNFVSTVALKDGMNEIVITVLDGKGNSTQISRRVNRR